MPPLRADLDGSTPEIRRRVEAHPFWYHTIDVVPGVTTPGWFDLRHSLDLLVDEDELAQRKVGWAPLPPRYTTGVLGKYAKLVGSAAQGAICG